MDMPDVDLFDNDYWDPDIDVVHQKEYLRFLSQALDSPLIDIPLFKIKAVLGEQIPPMKLKKNFRAEDELEFVEHVKTVANDHYKSRSIKWSPYSPEFLALYIKQIVNMSLEDVLESPEIHSIPVSLTNEIYDSLRRSLEEKLPQATLPTPGDVNSNPLVKAYYTVHCELRDILDAARSSGLNCTAYKSVPFYGGRLLLTPKYFAIIYPVRIIYGSYDMFLCIHDCIRSRYLSHLSVLVLRKPGLSNELLEMQYDWQFSVLEKYGNEGYDLVKAPEALWKCWVSRLADGSYASPDSFDRMIMKMEEKESKLSTEITVIQTLKDYIMSVDNVEVAVELFGCIKSSGFPIIDPKVGGQSAQDHAKAPDTTNWEDQAEAWDLFSHLLLINYIKQEGRWPPITFKSKKTFLYRLWSRGKLHIEDGSYPLSDWRSADIKKIFDLDYFPDYMDLLSDKACAPPKSLVKMFYDNKVKDKGNIRRLLRVMLARSGVDTVELMHSFARDTLSKDEYNIFLYPKEKEFKIAARMFCMMTFNIRLIFTIVQENVKASVFKYFPYQSMTLSSDELTNRLLNMTRSSSTSETLFIEVDLARWNLCFRAFGLKGYGMRLDNLFGVSNIFGRSPEIFSKSLVSVFVNDHIIPQFEDPLIQESSMQWVKHYGGFEGIDQATMTLATIIMIYKSLWLEKCSFILLGQGDNQTLAITRRNVYNESIASFSTRIMKKIEKTCYLLNHTAKPEEFIDSLSVLTYSKVFFVKGRMIPMEIKFSQSIAPITSSEIPSFGDSLGAIFSAAVGSAQNAMNPLLHWYLALLAGEDLCLRFKKTGGWFGSRALKRCGFSNLTNSQVKLALMVPSILGGFPICTWTNFIIRHEPDPLTGGISSLRYLMDSLKELCHYFKYLESDEPYWELPVKLDKLIADPESLPFKNPPTQKSLLQGVTEKHIRVHSSNKDVREALSASKAQGNTLLEALMSMRPLYPTIAHDLWELSSLGKVEKILSTFTLTRTLVSLARGTENIQKRLLYSEYRNIENNLMRFSSAMRHGQLTYHRNDLSHDIAERFRLRWGLGTSNLVGLSVTHPLDYLITCGSTNIFGVRSTLVFDAKNISPVTHQGSKRPYLGGKTYERRSGQTYEVKKTQGTNDLKKLVALLSAGGVGLDLTNLVDSIIKSRTSISSDIIVSLFPKIIGGILAHRYESLRKDGRIAPVGNITYQSNIQFCTDDVPGVSGSTDDYPIVFQQFFCYLIGFGRLLANSMVRSGDRCVTIQLTSNGLKRLEQTIITVDQTKQEKIRLDTFESPLITISKLEIIKSPNLLINTIGRPVNLQKLTSSKGGVIIFLVSLLIIEASKRSPALVQLDSSELGTTPPVTIDAAVFDVLGSEVFVEASVRAASILSVITKSLSNLGKASTVASITSILEKWVEIVFEIWRPHLNRSNSNKEYLENLGLIKHLPGERNNTYYPTATFRTIFHRARRIITNPFDSRLFTPVIAVGKGTSKLFLSVYLISSARVIWTLYSLRKDKGLFASLKKVYEYLSRDLLNSTPPDLLARRYAANIRESMDNGNLPWSDICYDELTLILNKGYGATNLSPEEAWRVFRTLPRVDVIKTKVIGPFNYIIHTGDVNPFGTIVKYSGQPNRLPPYFLEQSEKVGEVMIVGRHMGQKVGVYSSSANLWEPFLYPLSKEKVKSVGVLGTGAGGIQVLLESLGITSVGYDLQSSIPSDLIGQLVYRPPELVRYNLNRPFLTEESELSSGNILNEQRLRDAIYKYQHDVLIWDLELKSGQRLFLEPFRLLGEINYVGLVFVKLFLYKREAEHLIGYLSGLQGITLAIGILTTGCLSDEWTIPVCIRAEIKEDFTLQQESHTTATISAERTSYPKDIYNENKELLDLINHLVGNFIKVSLPINLIKITSDIRDLIRDTEGNYKGHFSSSNWMALQVILGLLELLRQIMPMSSMRATNILVAATHDGWKIRTSGRVITPNSTGWRRMIRTILPKIYSIMSEEY